MAAAGRFAVQAGRDPVFQVEAYDLLDRDSGSRARVTPALGGSLMSFAAGLSSGPLETMMRPSPDQAAPRPTAYGAPVLFPFPNRLRDGRFTFDGEEYRLDVAPPGPHHSHGLVRGRPWRVVEAGATAEGAAIACELLVEDHPDILRQYPFPFRLTLRYTLQGSRLRLAAEARNLGDRLLPMGFGLHPYFALPLREGGRGADCRVFVPARRLWVLDGEMLPTGQVVPVPPELDFRSYRPLAGAPLDHIYGDLEREDGWATCRLFDPEARVELAVRFGPEFPFVVVFAPAARPTICFEPYTCVTDAANLAARGVTGTGLSALAPGATWRGCIEFAVAEKERA